MRCGLEGREIGREIILMKMGGKRTKGRGIERNGWRWRKIWGGNKLKKRGFSGRVRDDEIQPPCTRYILAIQEWFHWKRMFWMFGDCRGVAWFTD
jgi:hypothetical protein